MKQIHKSRDYFKQMRQVNTLRHNWRNDPTDPAKTKYYFGCMSPDDPDTDHMTEEHMYAAYLERKENGFDRSECWDLGHNICKYILPRLKHFEKATNGTPAEFIRPGAPQEVYDKEYHDVLNKLIWALECRITDDLTLEDKWAEEIGLESAIKAWEIDSKKWKECLKTKYQEIEDVFKQYGYILFNLWW